MASVQRRRGGQAEASSDLGLWRASTDVHWCAPSTHVASTASTLAPATLAPAFVATARTTALATSDSRHHALAPGVVRRTQPIGMSPAEQRRSSLTPESLERPPRKNRGRSITAGYEMDSRKDPPYEEVVDRFFMRETEAKEMGEMGEEEAGEEVAMEMGEVLEVRSTSAGSPSPDEVVAGGLMRMDLRQAKHETVQAGEVPYPQGLPLAEPAASAAAHTGPDAYEWFPPTVLDFPDPPIPPYVQFDKEKREELSKGYKGVWSPLVPADAAQVARDISSLVGKGWNELSFAEERQRREAQYVEDVKKYRDECEERGVRLTPSRRMPGNQDAKSKQHRPSRARKPYSNRTRNRQPGGAEDSVRRTGGFAELPAAAITAAAVAAAASVDAAPIAAAAPTAATVAVAPVAAAPIASAALTAFPLAPPTAKAGEAEKVRPGGKRARGARLSTGA